jgi:NAD(P)-dependent dehydrogenase (short-subunit alcohol dehydrogenase family)
MRPRMTAPTRTVIVTGANSGIGKATVEHFADRDWSVIATMRRLEFASLFAGRPNVSVHPLDVSDAGSVEAFGAAVLVPGRQIDVLVNNAGFLQVGPLEASSMAQIREQFETNVFGVIAMSKLVLPHFRARKAGTIINIGSISAENGYPFASAYSASKGAILSLTEGLNIELEAIGASAKVVLPGMHATDIFRRLVPATDIPLEYRAALMNFNRTLGTLKGSPPETAAKAVFKAATDRGKSRVRYYAGPDAHLIPYAKRLLGFQGYWQFFRRIMVKGPSPMVQRLSPQGKLDMNIDMQKAVTFKG